jgi:hypothetical protein
LTKECRLDRQWCVACEPSRSDFRVSPQRGTAGSFFSDDNIKYHLDWINCAEQSHGIQVDYMVSEMQKDQLRLDDSCLYFAGNMVRLLHAIAPTAPRASFAQE